MDIFLDAHLDRRSESRLRRYVESRLFPTIRTLTTLRALLWPLSPIVRPPRSSTICRIPPEIRATLFYAASVCGAVAEFLNLNARDIVVTLLADITRPAGRNSSSQPTPTISCLAV